VKYDNSHRTHRQFNVGDLVLVKKNIFTRNDDRYDGPGEVIGKCSIFVLEFIGIWSSKIVHKFSARFKYGY